MTGPVPYWMAWDIARVLVWRRDLMPPHLYVDSIAAEASDAAWDSFGPG